MFWAIAVGAVTTVLSACLAHLVRAEGYSREAGIGIIMSGVLNMLLDPLFIFTFRMEIAGAALATMLSNVASVVYFVVLLARNRQCTVIAFDPRYYTLKHRIPGDALLAGLPSFLMFIMGLVSKPTLNKKESHLWKMNAVSPGCGQKTTFLPAF